MYATLAESKAAALKVQTARMNRKLSPLARKLIGQDR